jgi:DNA repair protein RadB
MKISTGSYDLNDWLEGGYEEDIITMVAGSPASGKTNFAILTACSQAKDGKKVLFIDTEGGFSSERVRQIVGEENLEDILENMILSQPVSFEEQKKLFEKLLERIRKEDISLIVVDGMAMLYRLELGDAVQSNEDEKIKSVNREVAKQMRMLAEISRKKNIPVFITNQVYTEFLKQDEIEKGRERKTNIVGGDLFKYWSKCIIELKKQGNRRKAYLLKHRSLPEKEMSFEIKDLGVFRKRLL